MCRKCMCNTPKHHISIQYHTCNTYVAHLLGYCYSRIVIVIVYWWHSLIRVPTNLNIQGKPEESDQGQLGKLFFLKLIIMELTNVVIFICKMSQLSCHTPCKASRKMLKMVADIYGQVKEKVRKSHVFFVGTLVIILPWMWLLLFQVVTYIDSCYK